MHIDDDNSIFQQAVSFVTHTAQSLFLTGKAGTGKTTFLKYIRAHCSKKMAVTAPTGVAAINAGGTTLHSFFHLPFGAFLAEGSSAWGGGFQKFYNKNQLLRNIKLRQNQRELIRSLELLVIDEISMVRADTLDAIDVILRSVRRKPYEPFGGLQLLLIGDLHQLPPVVKNEEWDVLRQRYASPFFFDAQVMNDLPLLVLELEKIYRQEDERFIRLLQHIRNNCCSPEDLAILESRYQPHFEIPEDENYITLSTHNSRADLINNRALERLNEEPFECNAVIKDNFPENAYPADKILRLKKDAQVMFIKNDKGEDRRYYNGKIGRIVSYDRSNEKIQIAFPDGSEIIELEREQWKNIRYDYNKEKDEIKEEVLGSFDQFPIRLAWAVTIHKSQGLTFDRAVIDAGRSFAPGQVYVALSRLRSLDGVVLQSRINPNSIFVDPRIEQFMKRQRLAPEKMHDRLSEARTDYVRRLLIQVFDWQNLEQEWSLHFQSYSGKLMPDKEQAMASASAILDALQGQHRVATSFCRFLQASFQQVHIDYNRIRERTKAAAEWFSNELEQSVILPIESQIVSLQDKKRVKTHRADLQTLLILAKEKKAAVEKSSSLTAALQQDGALQEALDNFRHREPDRELLLQPVKNTKAAKGESKRTSCALFREGISINEIATIRGLSRTTIEGHLIEFVGRENGIDIAKLVSEAKQLAISKLITQQPDISLAQLKELLGDSYSYLEIRATRSLIRYRQSMSQTPEQREA